MLIEEYGCDPNVVTKRDESLLHYACLYGHIDVIKLLIGRYGCNPNVVTKNDESLLHYACLFNHMDTVKLLIEKYCCDPNVVTKSNQSLLHYACRYYGNIEYFINKQHLNPLMRDNINQLEPLDYAVNNNQYSIAVYICQHCISSDEMLSPNRIKTTINLIKYISAHTGACCNEVQIWITTNGDNILQLVGASGTCIAHIPSAAVSEILSSHKANCIITYFKPDLRTADGDTILQLILQSEISISRISSQTLVKLLSNSRKITINEMKNVNPIWKTLDGAHFPHVVCLTNVENNKLIELMQYYILENGWDPDTCDGEGNTIIHIVCKTDNLV
jgi:ankyrin repeat protein